MPRDQIKIADWAKGFASGIDSEDMADNVASYNLDVDVKSPIGIIRGRLTDSIIASGVKGDTSGYTQAFAFPSGTYWNIVAVTDAGVAVIFTDIYGSNSQASLGSFDVDHGLSVVPYLNGAYIGQGPVENPKWVGYTPWDKFGVAQTAISFRDMALADPKGTTAGLSDIAITDANSHTAVESDYFREGMTYYYFVCYVHHGYQRSPISEDVYATQSINPGDSADYIEITLTVNGYVSLPNTVTHVEVYRAEKRYVGAESETRGFARLVKRYSTQDFSDFTDNDPDATIVYKDYGEWGQSYEQITGVPDLLTEQLPKYGLSCMLNNSLWIGRASHSEIPDASHMLFKSRPMRFAQFNYAEEYVVLPKEPIALAAFGGRLYAFDDTNTYRINPEAMVIEDVIEGVGALGKDSVVTSDHGLYVWGQQSIFLITPSAVSDIGLGIRQGPTITGFSPVTLATITHHDNAPVGAFSGDLMSIVWTFSNGTEENMMLVFNIPNKAWYLWSFDTVAETENHKNVFRSLFSGKYGELYYTMEVYEGGSVGAPWRLSKLCGGTSRKPWKWYSKVYAGGAKAQKRKFYLVKALPLVASDVFVEFDEDGTHIPLVAGKIGSAYRSANSMRVLIEGDATESCGTLEIVFRNMIGLR